MSIIGGIGNFFRAIGHALASLFTATLDTETGIFTAYFSMKDDVDAFIKNLNSFKRFDFNPAWATRVINVPRAVDGINDLLDIIIHGFRDKFEELAHSLETVAQVIEQLSKRPPEEGAGAIANVQSSLATFKLAATNVQTAFHAALQIETMLLDVKNRLETLDDLFLPQGNPRKTVSVTYRQRQR